MGLGDFFRRREPAPARPTPANPTPGGGPSIAYLFAHMGLPGAAFANPAGFLASMAHPHALKPTHTILGGWTADRTHVNFFARIAPRNGPRSESLALYRKASRVRREAGRM